MEMTRHTKVTTPEEIVTHPRCSAIESEVNLAAGTWIMAEHVRPGDLVSLGEGRSPFIVSYWIGCRDGIIIYDELGDEHLCTHLLPHIFMVEADFMRKNFPTAM